MDNEAANNAKYFYQKQSLAQPPRKPSLSRTAVIGSAKMLLATANVRFGKLRCSVEILSQSPPPFATV
jgi:hypothetical protein